MKKLIVTFLLLSFTMILSAQQVDSLPFIEVTGNAELKVVPDTFYLGITLRESDQKNRVSLQVLESRLFATLNEAGIDPEKQLSVEDLDSSFQKLIARRSRIELTKEFELVIRDAALLSRLLPALEESGISNIRLKKSDHSKIEEYRKKVRILAIQAAKEKADYLSSAIGQKSGKAIQIWETGGAIPYRAATNRSMMLSESADSFQADIPFKEITLSASYRVHFELK